MNTINNNNANANANNFRLDFFKKQIIGSTASFKKASLGNGAVYEELVYHMEKHPDFTLVEVKPKTKSKKRTYKGLVFKFMEAYILIQEDGDKTIKVYENIKAIAKKQGFKVYPYTKQWFLETFKGFDMDAAKDANRKSEYEMAIALLEEAIAEAEEEEAAEIETAAA